MPTGGNSGRSSRPRQNVNYDNIKIEQGHEVPPRRMQGVSVLIAKLADANVGDSFFVPYSGGKPSNIGQTAKARHGDSKWITTRTIKDDTGAVTGVRVWKRAEPPKGKGSSAGA